MLSMYRCKDITHKMTIKNDAKTDVQNWPVQIALREPRLSK